MTSYKYGIKIILSFSILLFASSCKTEKPATIIGSPDTVTTVHTIPKRSFSDSFPQLSGYVNDYDVIFSKDEKANLENIITAFEKETTIQIAVITFTNGMTTADGLDSLTLRIAKKWGVGQKNKDNGILIGFSKYLRKMRIQNGYGIERILSDAETKKMIDEDFIPSFKQGKYFEGMKKGLLSLMQKLREKYTA